MITLYLTDVKGTHSGREYWENRFGLILRIVDRLERAGFSWSMDCVGADELEIAYWRLSDAVVRSRCALEQGKRVVINGKVYGGAADIKALRAYLIGEHNEGRLILQLYEEDRESLTLFDGRYQLPYNRN